MQMVAFPSSYPLLTTLVHMDWAKEAEMFSTCYATKVLTTVTDKISSHLRHKGPVCVTECGSKVIILRNTHHISMDIQEAQT